jgi:lipid A disaccharide synthetase
MLCILPFEEEICRLNGLPATYVGHPLLDDAAGLNVVRAIRKELVWLELCGFVLTSMQST